VEGSIDIIGGILEYECLECGAVAPNSPSPGEGFGESGESGGCPGCNECGSYWLSPVYDYKGLGKTILTSLRSSDASGMWRYSALLPAVASENIVTLSEGGTPLIRLKGIEKATSCNNIERGVSTGS
jgi:threonine synthase